MSRIRVLVNGLHAKTGGGITYLRNILPALASDTALELHLFLHRDQLKSIGAVDERVRVHLFDFPGSVLHLMFWEQIALPILGRIMQAEVTLSPANYGPIAAPGAVIVLRNSLAVAGRETRLAKRLYWAAMALMTAASLVTCQRAIAVSNYARRALTFGLSGQIRRKVVVINHGVSRFFCPTDPPTQREQFLLVVADLYIQKNLHTLLVAIARLVPSFPGITLRIAGNPVDPEYEQELHRLIAAHNLGDRVTFLGSVTPVALLKLYRTCQFLVFPSTVETFGNPIVEAMACGTPIACSNRAAMPEIAGDAALYFDPLSIHEMELALRRLIDDPELRARLSFQGLAQARQFSWERTSSATAVLLAEVGERLRARHGAWPS